MNEMTRAMYDYLWDEVGMPKHIKTIPGGYTQQKCFICGKAYTTLYSRKFKDEDGTTSKIRLCRECLESATAAHNKRKQEGRVTVVDEVCTEYFKEDNNES